MTMFLFKMYHLSELEEFNLHNRKRRSGLFRNWTKDRMILTFNCNLKRSYEDTNLIMYLVTQEDVEQWRIKIQNAVLSNFMIIIENGDLDEIRIFSSFNYNYRICSLELNPMNHRLVIRIIISSCIQLLNQYWSKKLGLTS